VEFCRFHWPCSYSKLRKGELLKCVNLRSGHEKGHQTKDGNIFADGLYRSDFSPQTYGKTWTESIANHVEDFQAELDVLRKHGDREISDLKLFEPLHVTHMSKFFASVRDAQLFVSHSTCFCCLMQVPNHPLPCGHVLCTSCIKGFGRRKSRVTCEMLFCPLHQEETEIKWQNQLPWIIKFNPEFAGVRLLSLDG
jgi:hypothetical protein